MLEFNNKCVKAQMDYCKEHGYPCFVIPTGVCYNCHKPIFDETGKNGYTYEEAKSVLITNCRNCSYTYCD